MVNLLIVVARTALMEFGAAVAAAIPITVADRAHAALAGWIDDGIPAHLANAADFYPRYTQTSPAAIASGDGLPPPK